MPSPLLREDLRQNLVRGGVAPTHTLWFLKRTPPIVVDRELIVRSVGRQLVRRTGKYIAICTHFDVDRSPRRPWYDRPIDRS